MERQNDRLELVADVQLARVEEENDAVNLRVTVLQ